MKKIIISLILILLLCGCGTYQENEYSESTGYIGTRFTVFVDAETCVEYFVSNGASNIGNVIPRYNQDGTLKTNNKCLNDLERKGE